MLVKVSFNKKFWKNKRVFITGHTGFKGSWLFFLLIQKGAIVHGYSKNYSNNHKTFKNLTFSRMQTIGDVNNYKDLKKSLKSFRPHIILHLAAQPLVLQSYKNSYQTFLTNIFGTINLLEISKNINSLKSICLVTTDKVYDEDYTSNYFHENDRLGGKDPYSSSKVSKEIIAKSYYESFLKQKKISLFTVRAGNVIGGGDWSKNRLIPDIFRAYRSKKKLIIRNQNHTRPWQHVLDVLDAYLKLTEYSCYKLLNDSWNIGPKRSKQKNVIELVNLFKKRLAFEYRILNNKNSEYESNFLQLNNKKIRNDIGWQSNFDLNNSIDWTIDWYLNNDNNLNKTINQINKFIKKYD